MVILHRGAAFQHRAYMATVDSLSGGVPTAPTNTSARSSSVGAAIRSAVRITGLSTHRRSPRGYALVVAEWWVAVIGAASALAGSGITMVGQVLTEGRRERLADRHRFADLKRAAYGEYLGSVERILDHWSGAIRDSIGYIDQIGDGGGPEPSDLIDRHLGFKSAHR